MLELPGNGPEYAVALVEKTRGGILDGKTIIFLGSSVTEGACSCGESFVDYLEHKDGVIPVKEAVSGTTLVTMDDTSYIPRMKKIETSIKADAFVCQLSTNDATKELPFGTVSNSFHRDDFDTTTIAGSIEYIISYAMDTWKCPVVFYTGTKFDSETYGNMVALLRKLQEKWKCGVIDLWNDTKLNSISEEQRNLYMNDGIHPTKAGYMKWWLPKIENYLEKLMNNETGISN